MALTQLPSYLKPVDARLVVRNATDEQKSEINLRNPVPYGFREVLFLEAAFAPIAAAYVSALQAWVEALDGRVTAFKMPMTPRVWGAECSATIAISATTTRGSGEIPVTVTGTIPAGALIGVGDIETTYQMFEVLEAATSATTALKVAPRVRHAFTTSAAVVVGSSVYGRFKLASDESGGVALRLDRGVISLAAVEAI
jgi:hypothetical protein